MPGFAVIVRRKDMLWIHKTMPVINYKMPFPYFTQAPTSMLTRNNSKRLNFQSGPIVNSGIGSFECFPE